MITGVTAVAPSGDGGPVRFTVSTAASSQSSSTEQAASTSSLAIAKPESSSAGSSTQNQQQGQRRTGDGGGDTAATGAYLARLLAASITGRAPEGPRPSKITPERLSMLISYLESSVATTAPSRSKDEHAVDVTS